jgi:hypothetical protein
MGRGIGGGEVTDAKIAERTKAQSERLDQKNTSIAYFHADYEKKAAEIWKEIEKQPQICIKTHYEF